jgi:putative DNA primase/helicase
LGEKKEGVMRVRTVEAARGRWKGILSHFGLTSEHLSGKHGGCPICKTGKDKWRFDNKDGTGSYYCNGCGAGYGIDLVQKLTGKEFKDAAKAVDQIIGKVSAEPAKKEKSEDEIRAYIKRVLSETHRTDSMGYLASRGIKSSPNVVFHDALEYWHEKKMIGKFPAMIGIVRDVSGKGVAIHRTYLKQGGKADVEAPRKMSGTVGPIHGGAIRLYPAKDVLGVAEGIETACSAHDIFDVPVWSCINTTLLESFMPPPGVKKLIVFADNDANYAGQRSAYILANKQALRGVNVEVRIPQEIGDWNDECLKKIL